MASSTGSAMAGGGKREEEKKIIKKIRRPKCPIPLTFPLL